MCNEKNREILKAFAEKAADALSQRMDGEYTFGVIERVKTNDLHLTGIVAQDVEISPVIYVNGYAESLEEGKASFEECMNEIEDTFRACMENCPDADIASRSPEELRKKVTFRVLGKARNEDLISGRISRDIAPGLCAVFDVRVGEDGMIPVDSETLKFLKLTETELVDLSFENSQALCPATICRLEDSIGKTSGAERILEIETLGTEETPSVFVVSNEEGFMGAASIFYPGVMEKLRRLMGCDYYVVPSSVHEFLVIPETDAPPLMEISRVIADANSIIPPEDVLTDMPYIYRESYGLQQAHLPAELS